MQMAQTSQFLAKTVKSLQIFELTYVDCCLTGQ